MTFSILAALFLVMLMAVIFYGYGFIIRSNKLDGNAGTERCTICRGKFEKGQLIEREVGDSKLIYFCKTCIIHLYDDVTKA